ncbi:MAG: hypothetical protein U1E45_24550 [Geminicoccaceae bacterium]
MTPRRYDIRLAAFLLAVLALNFPVLAIVDSIEVGGRPSTLTYLFAAWFVVIGIGALVNLRTKA